MFFYVKKIIGALVLPPTGPLLLALGGLFLLRRKPRVGRGLAFTGTLVLFAASLPPVSAGLNMLICDSGPLDPRQVAAAQAIVVLGGGLRRDATEYGGDTLNWLSLERVRYAAALARETRLPVLVTGGSVYGTGRPEADVMREVLDREFRISVQWVERESRNTHENAVFSAKLLKREAVSRILLVAHGVDIRRARREFSATGLQAIPAPTVIPSMTVNSFLQLLPSMGALAGSYLALYELLANVAMTLHLNGA